MSGSSSSATNPSSEDSGANQPLINPTSDCPSRSENNQDKSEERYTKQRLVSPKISIGHVYVYNFSPGQPADSTIDFPSPSPTIVKTKHAIVSPAASSGPFCRICHEGDSREDLLSPCFCTGTVGLIHLSCAEKWLETSGSDKCEICHFAFPTVRHPKSFTEWIRSASTTQGQRTLWGDITCLLLLTPLAAVSSFLSIDGALKQIRSQHSIEAGCLVALATFLITVYFIWSILTFRYHLNCYLKWRQKNHHVKILVVRRLSSTDERFLSNKKLPRNIRRSTETPRIHRQNHRIVNIPTSSPEAGNWNDSGPTRTVATETRRNDNQISTYSEYDFNRSEFIEHLTAMFETAL